eukprot:364164-Chlamydomonas_euryale.AAC.9
MRQESKGCDRWHGCSHSFLISNGRYASAGVGPSLLSEPGMRHHLGEHRPPRANIRRLDSTD